MYSYLSGSGVWVCQGGGDVQVSVRVGVGAGICQGGCGVQVSIRVGMRYRYLSG